VTEPTDPPVSEPAATVADLLAELRATNLPARGMVAMRPSAIGLGADLDELSPEFAGLYAELREIRGIALAPWSKAVRIERGRRAKVALEKKSKQLRAQAIAPDAEPLARIRGIQAALQYGPSGPRGNVANLLTVLANDPRWQGRLAYHALREMPITLKPIEWHEDDAPEEAKAGDWTEQDSTRACAWMSREYEIDAPESLVTSAIQVQACKKTINPIRDYMRGLVWDGHVRLPTWLSVYLGAKQTPYSEAVGTRWLISGAARSEVPGCKVDCVLVLEDPKQGTGKTTAFRTLCADPSWFFEDELKVGDAQSVGQSLQGKMIVELGELSVLSKGDLSALKGLITRQTDSYRQSYGRRNQDFPRRPIFGGSTNFETYLVDDENRRFWPVRTSRIDIAALTRDRDQLWAEAMVRYGQGEPWHVDTAELAALCTAEQEKRARPDPWETWIGDWIRRSRIEMVCCLKTGRECDCFECAGVTTAAVLLAATNTDKDKQTDLNSARVGRLLRRMGWVQRGQATQHGSRVRPYYPSVAWADYADARIEYEAKETACAEAVAAENERLGM
jgi:putative DNA primase/helicase